MENFYETIKENACEHLLKATPYTKETRDNFDGNLKKDQFFSHIYTERSNNPDFDSENDLFDKKIEQALGDLNNRYGKVSMIHIAGYGGCGKTTFVHHLLWTLHDNIGVYDVIDYEGCTAATEPFINRAAHLIHKFYNISDLLVYFEKITSRKLYNVNRFRDQLPLLKEFTTRIKDIVNSEKIVESSYKVLLELFEEDYLNEIEDTVNGKKNFLSFLLFLEFTLLLFDRFFKHENSEPMILVIDNADNLGNLAEEAILLPIIREFENNCNYFFGWNLQNDFSFNGKNVSDVIKNTKLTMFFTTRIATMHRYESTEPDWEKINGWTSLRFPKHYYDHKEIINRRIAYYLSIENIDSSIAKQLILVKHLTDIAYRNYNFMRLFNGSIRVCVERICSIIESIHSTQIMELLNLYETCDDNLDTVEGCTGYFLYLVLSVFKAEHIYHEKLNLGPCRKDGKISLSRMILTILREKGDRCSILDMLKLLTPFGFDARLICTQVWNLCEISRENAWRRLLVFDVIVPANIEDLYRQAVIFERGDSDPSHYSELIICSAGQAYMEFVLPHFEFMLSRHDLGVGTYSQSKYRPLFSASSENKLDRKNSSKVVYDFERKIDWVYSDVKDCCYNSMIFANSVMTYFNINREEYIKHTFYNYHSSGWGNEVGPKQSYESRLIFRHVGYIEKYRCYLLKKKQKTSLSELADINRRLVERIVKYLKLYQDPFKCCQTEAQNNAAIELLELADVIKRSGYTDFTTRIELND